MLAVRHALSHARRRPAALLGGSNIRNAGAGTNFDTTYRISCTVGPSGVQDLVLVFGGWFMTISPSNETPTTNTVTYKLAIETGGQSIPVFFPGGVRSVALAPSQQVASLPVAVSLAAASTFNVRVEASISGVGSLPFTEVLSPAVTFTAGDHVDATGALGTSQSDSPAPLAILGRLTNPARRTVAILGDSIAEGFYTGHNYGSGLGTGDSVVNRGFIRAALGTSYANINVACPGELAHAYVTASAGRLELIRLAQCDYAISNYGINDLYNGRTVVQTEQDLVTIWLGLVPRCPMGVYQTTITPKTTSTDAWATTANQTIFNSPAGVNTLRTTLNAWIRAGGPIDPVALTPVAVGTPGALVAGGAGHPLKGIFEVADKVESARDSGLWAAGGLTSDGTHPNGTGVPIAATAVDTTLLV